MTIGFFLLSLTDHHDATERSVLGKAWWKRLQLSGVFMLIAGIMNLLVVSYLVWEFDEVYFLMSIYSLGPAETSTVAATISISMLGRSVTKLVENTTT